MDGSLSTAMHAAFRTIRLFAGWVTTGALAGVLTGVLLCLILTRHSDGSPGDGILVFALWSILVPLGALLGTIRAIVIWEKRKGWT